MAQITIILKSTEKDALQILAEQEFRDTRAQAALIIRQELERRGLLATQEAVQNEDVHLEVKDDQ